MADVLGPLRTYLIAQGIVRNPTTASGLPPMWLEPQYGTPAPGELPRNGNAVQVGADIVLAAFLSGGLPVGPYESSWRIPTIDLRIRGRTSPLVKAIEAQITSAVIDKREWMLGPLLVIESQLWRPLQPLAIDDQSFDFIVSYSFQVLAS